MNAHELLSDDGHAVLALCSNVGLPGGGDLAPFTLSEWNELAGKIEGSPLRCPSALHGQSASALAAALQLSTGEAERITRLLERSGRLAMELERLFGSGLWAVTRVDEYYPAKLRDTLKHQAPSVLFGAGDIQLLRRSGVAVIGSRNIDEAGSAFAQEVGRKCAVAKVAVVSGGARGTDRIAMQAALEADGVSFGVLADSLERTVRTPDVREFLLEGRLVLLTPYAPTAGFSVGAAMGRNKTVYGLSDFAVVVSSDFQTGGTWAGAVEALKADWCPVFVRDGDGVPKGNPALQKLGAMAMTADDLANASDLPAWAKAQASQPPVAKDLFDFALRERAGK